MKEAITRAKKIWSSMLLFVFLCGLSFTATMTPRAQANSWLSVADAGSDSSAANINRGTYSEVFKLKITAGSENIKIISMRLYGENEDGGILSNADIGNGALYDESGKQVANGSLYRGYWSFIYMSMDISAGQSKILTFKSSVSETTEIEKFRIIANEKYISAIKPATGESMDWNDTSVARSEALTATDIAGRWITLNASTTPIVPDLTTMSGYSSPVNPYLSEKICYHISVVNYGLADVSGKEIFASLSINQKSIGKKSFGDTLKISGLVDREVFCSDQLEAGLLHAGSNTVEFVLDPDNTIAETNEGNNRRTFTMNVVDATSSLPDLVPIEPDCHIATPSGDAFVICNYKIQNNGSVQVTGTFKVSANETIREWAATPPAGKWVNMTISADVPSDGKIIITADPDNMLHEKDETNNSVMFMLPGYGGSPAGQVVSMVTDFEDGALVRIVGDPKVYLLKGGYKYWIKTAQDFLVDGFDWNKIITVDAGALQKYGESEYVPQGKIVVRVAGDFKVYRIIGGRRLWIPSARAFQAQGLEWNKISEIPVSSLGDYPELKLIKAVGSDTIYYVTASGMKKVILTTDVFNSYGNRYEDVVEVDPSVVASFETVNLIKDATGKVYKIEGNQKKWISTLQAFARYGFDWTKVAPVNETELNAYADGGIII